MRLFDRLSPRLSKTLSTSNYMFGGLSVAAALVLLLGSCTTFAADASATRTPAWQLEPSSYRGIEWCATEQVVRKVLPTEECNAPSQAEPEHRFCIVEMLFPKSISRVAEVYEFKSDRLMSVSVEFRKDSFESAVSLLEKGFGQPSTVTPSGELVWSGQNVRLTVQSGRPSPIAWFEVLKCR